MKSTDHLLKSGSWEVYLKLQHSFFHAFYIEDHLNQLLDWGSQLGSGPCPHHQFHCFFLAIVNVQWVELPCVLDKVVSLSPIVACLVSIYTLKLSFGTLL